MIFKIFKSCERSLKLQSKGPRCKSTRCGCLLIYSALINTGSIGIAGGGGNSSRTGSRRCGTSPLPLSSALLRGAPSPFHLQLLTTTLHLNHHPQASLTSKKSKKKDREESTTGDSGVAGSEKKSKAKSKSKSTDGKPHKREKEKKKDKREKTTTATTEDKVKSPRGEKAKHKKKKKKEKEEKGTVEEEKDKAARKKKRKEAKERRKRGHAFLLTDLPVEIQLLVMTFLTAPGLCAASLVCKEVRRVCHSVACVSCVRCVRVVRQVMYADTISFLPSRDQYKPVVPLDDRRSHLGPLVRFQVPQSVPGEARSPSTRRR